MMLTSQMLDGIEEEQQTAAREAAHEGVGRVSEAAAPPAVDI